ncbi:MAG: hypothetical protein V4603_04585 [Pseudomonadota bacterium]
MKTLLKLLLIVPFLFAGTLALADNRSNRGHDNGRHEGWSNRDRGNWDNRANSRRRNNDNVSLNVIVGGGSRYYPGYNTYNRYNNYNSFNTFGWGVGYSTFGSSFGSNLYINNSYPYSRRYVDRRPIIIERNTYIERPVNRGSVTTYSNRRDSGTSLLRDINGRCFERYVDSRGNETRTELDASECDF